MMRTKILLTLAVGIGLSLASSLSLRATTKVGELRCEFLKNPSGIDVTEPRLSWILESKQRGDRQTAYQVLVATTPEKLKPGAADLWDSGKVASDQSIHVCYAGQPLPSRQPCFWKIRVWDQHSRASAWSALATWSMGLLHPDDWQGHWIGKDEATNTALLTSGSWIWFPEGRPETDAPVGTRYFRRTFELPAGRSVRQAKLQLAGDNEWACAVNGQHAGTGGNFKATTTMDVTRSLKPGRNVVAGWVKNAGEGPNPAGLVGILKIEFESGEPLVIPTDAAWKTTNQESGAWTALEYDDSTWVPAKVLGPSGMPPWGEVFGPDDRRLAARMLRKEFTVARKVTRATAYLSGLGLSELHLNGQKVGADVLSPALSEYPKRVFYVTHDVTAQIKRGANALGVWLGNGRFYAPRATVPTGTSSFGFPKLLLQLEVDYADGTRETIVSDTSWKLTTDGPILANNEYDGEEYDARKEMPGWAKEGFDDSTWAAAQLVHAPTFNPDSAKTPVFGGDQPVLGSLFYSAAGPLSAQMQEPIRVTDTLKPLAITEPKPGVFIYDLGQNMVGWGRLKLRGPAGTQVTLRFAETCKADGSLYLDNIRGAKVSDVYTLKGKGDEVYEPRFTYHGFRYVELTGFPGRPTLASIEGRVVNDDVATAGEFTCSQPTINRFYQNIVWGVRGNYRSISTDCPQRDERQGWLGDRSAESKGETFLFDIAALYAKWTQDMADAQKDNGSISDVCPSYWPLYNDNVTWPSSAVIIPGALLDQYGDAAIIARLYPNLVKWINHMSGFITNGIITKDNYGDWCVPPEDPKLIHSNDPARKTSPAILATCYFHHCLKLMAGYAKLLSKPDDAQRFATLAEQLKTALNEKFYNREQGFYDNGSQTACVLPLAFDMVPPEERPRVFGHLVKKITEETKGHVGTGLVGGQWLNRVLTDGGRPDIVYRFATNTAYPSWGYMVEKGATTVWELWNGDTADPAMNSGNHVMLVGDLVIWFYECLAGIKSDPAQPGFKHIIMKPHPVGDLRFVKATHRSPYGTIASAWKRDETQFDWQITVPPNTTATVYVPAAGLEMVSEGRGPARTAKGVKSFRFAKGAGVFEIESGSYHFNSTIPTQSVR
ncbi:MAG: family 78 glycoside hydrolase catalytic domain [Verrucomicrobia subdivision 3 bacterium]|nr:family 78 glycoside hydrolase catalytic domain [Limisphaerales bacterium]